MEETKVFKTKTGFCHIFDDKIILSRDGVIGTVAKVAVGNKLYRILIIYCISSLSLFYISYINFMKGQNILGALYIVFGGYLVFGIISSINNSASPIIDRKKIKKVKFIKGLFGITRARFEVFFEDENNKM